MIKFLASSVAATACSIVIAMCVLFILGLIVNLFKLNYGRDAYWVFSASFIAMIIVWVVCFGFFMSEEKIRPMPQDSPPVLIPKTRKKLPEPIGYLSSKVNGTVQSIHIGGRREIVPVVQVELTRYFHEENLWVLGGGTPNGGIIQPIGRKNYFMPVLSGNLDFNWKVSKPPVTQLFEASHLENDEDGETKAWSEFRVANIIFKDEEPVSLLFKHYAYEDGKWSEIAGYEAFFDGKGMRTPDDPVVKRENKVFEHPLFTEHAKKCKQCSVKAISGEDGPVHLCEKGFKLLQQDAINDQ